MWSAGSSDGLVDDTPSAATPADGDEGYSCPAPGDHPIKSPSLPSSAIDTTLTPEDDDMPVGDEYSSVLVLESGKSRIHGPGCSTLDPTSIFCKCACAHLALDGLGVVGRGHTGGREQSEHEHQA